jgi:alpha-galactosidase
MSQVRVSTTPNIVTKTSKWGRPVWILRLENSSYAFGLDTFGVLQHMWWGAALPLLSDYGEPTSAGTWSHERPQGISQEEYPAWGDLKFGEPALKLHYADGNRVALPRYQHSATDGDRLTLTFRDDSYGLLLELYYVIYPKFNLIERYSRLCNEGEAPIDLEIVRSALWRLPPAEYHYSYLTGRWGEDFQRQTTAVKLGKQVLESRHGVTGFDSNPFFAIHQPDASETHGDVYFGALAYSGNWQFVLEHNHHGQLALAGGMNPFDFRWRLDPGESLNTPKFIAGYTNRGMGEASRLLHHYHREQVLPKAFAKTPRPVLYNSWYATEFDVNLDNQLAAAHLAAELGVELFVMDDGWFGRRDSDKAGLGDWYPSATKFPDGLTPLIQAVNDLGMDFGLWIEPEMVNPDSDLYRAHPDWVYQFANRPLSQGRNQLILNLARTDVQEHLITVFDRLLADNKIRFIKWDMNRSFSEPGWPDAPEGRAQEIWLRHTLGVYYILETLRARHPEVLFESCASGGGRVDFGIFQHTDQAWMSDNTDSLADLYLTESYSLAYALKTRVVWVTDPSGLTQRTIPLDFRFHVAMLGTLGVGANLPQWSEAERRVARAHIATYKRLRETIQHGSLYRLRRVAASEVSAFQFISEDHTHLVVFIFLDHVRYGQYSATVRLQGLEAKAHYQPGNGGEPVSGQALMSRGLRLTIQGDYSSQLLEFRKISP